MAAEHLTNESTAWSLALGVAMVVAAVRPVVAAGLASVLTVFTTVLAVYVISDAAAGAVTLLRAVSHVPVLAGTVLAILVWRQTRRAGPEPGSATKNPSGENDDIVLPPHASRGRRKHLYPTDGSAA
jgi:predicted anti-sigma-YlaC factor YlaD